MMDEHEIWEVHGLNAIEQANNTHSTWNEFMAVLLFFYFSQVITFET
jgi:hypothetical protein